MTITQSIGVAVHNLALISGARACGREAQGCVALLDIYETVVLSFATGDAAGAGIGIQLAGVGLIANLRRNAIVARTGIGIGGGDSDRPLRRRSAHRGQHRLRREPRIDLGGTAAYLLDCRVTGNDVLSSQDVAIRATGAVAPGGSPRSGGIASPGTAPASPSAPTRSWTRTRSTASARAGARRHRRRRRHTHRPARPRADHGQPRGRQGGHGYRSARPGSSWSSRTCSRRSAPGSRSRARGSRAYIEDNEVFDVATVAGEEQAPFAVGIHVATSGRRRGRGEHRRPRRLRVPGAGAGGRDPRHRHGGRQDRRQHRRRDRPAGRLPRLRRGHRSGRAVRARLRCRTTPLRFKPRPAPSDGNWWALIIESAGGDDDQGALPRTGSSPSTTVRSR